MNASISWEMTPTTDTNLFLTTYKGGSHLPADIIENAILTMIQKNCNSILQVTVFSSLHIKFTF